MNERNYELETRFSGFCDSVLYPTYGIRVITRYCTESEQRRFGDKLLHGSWDDIRNEGHFTVDEKAASYLNPNMIWELIQDVESGSYGWFYDLRECGQLIYGYYDPESLAPNEPTVVYSIPWAACRRYALEQMKERKNVHYAGTRAGVGWGVAVNACYPWKLLLENGMAKQVWPAPR